MTAFSSVAQETEPNMEKGKVFDINKVYVGGNLGLSLVHGDIRQYNFVPVASYNSELSLGGHLYAGLKLNHGLSVNAKFGTGGLRGTKRVEGNNKSMYSVANFNTITANLQFDLSRLLLTKADSKFAYYASIGAGYIYYRSANYRLGSDELLAQYGYLDNETNPMELGEEDSRVRDFVIPFGFGAQYELTPQLDLVAEIQTSITNTDKLDAWERNDQDALSLTSIGLVYSFAKESEVEEWEDPLEAVIEDVEDIKTKVDGLTKDTDGDGVTDLNDKEPNTPAGVSVDGAGRALDVDGDGVPDHMDEEFSAKGAKVDGSGRELDSDGDGVADSKDQEPNTEKGAMVNFAGVTIKGTGSGSSSTGVSAGLPAVYFNLNSSSIDYKSFGAIAEVAKYLKANADVKLTVIGHTDASGSKAYNEKLGLRRAQTVIDHLGRVYGIDSARLKAGSKGDSEPLDISKSAVSNINRRVDFMIAE